MCTRGDLGRPRLGVRGELWVLAGRLTFSAAGNFAAELADDAEHEVFVGEPTGGSPNQFGRRDPALEAALTARPPT